MSIILSWENPQEAYIPTLHRAEVWRSTPDKKSVLFRVSDDAPWGIFEDKVCLNPDEIYEIHYIRSHGETGPIIRTEDIRRMIRPKDLCKIVFDLRNPDGFPSAARTIEISNEPVGTDFTQRVLTNCDGHAEFFAVYGARLQIKIDGWLVMLDCVVPRKGEVSFDDLRQHGTLLPSERRGLV